MVREEFDTLFEPAAINIFGKDRSEWQPYFELEKVFDTKIFKTYTSQSFSKDLPLSPKDRKMLEILVGPYGKVFYKMWMREKHGDEQGKSAGAVDVTAQG